jgi:hypothetical protein
MAKKVGSAADYIIPLGVVGVLGFLAWKFFGSGGGGGVGPSAAGANNQSLATANQQATAATAQQQAAAGEKAQMSAVQQQGLASQLYAQMSQDSPNLLTIKNLLMEPYTLTDLNAVIQYFGTKQVGSSGFNDCNLLGFNCSALDLPGWVALTFANDTTGALATINGYYSTQGINYSF